MRRVKLVIGILLVVGAVAFGVRALIDYIYWEGCRHRALPDMMALTAAVEHFRKTHGRLPSTDEFANLHPAPDFRLPWKSESPEMQTDFVKPEQRASEITDVFKRPFYYEPENDTFVIRSYGPDGIRSSDDFIHGPATK